MYGRSSTTLSDPFFCYQTLNTYALRKIFLQPSQSASSTRGILSLAVQPYGSSLLTSLDSHLHVYTYASSSPKSMQWDLDLELSEILLTSLIFVNAEETAFWSVENLVEKFMDWNFNGNSLIPQFFEFDKLILPQRLCNRRHNSYSNISEAPQNLLISKRFCWSEWASLCIRCISRVLIYWSKLGVRTRHYLHHLQIRSSFV
jgi:hypothetical protein